MPILAHPRVSQIDALTSLRFGAALYVVYFHYSVLFFERDASPPAASLGYTGVTFFFMLSGFILSYNYKSADLSSIYGYLLARVARIYPAFLFSLLIGLPFFIKAVAQIDEPDQKLLAASAVLLAPLGLHAWVPGAACSINCPSWSVSTEFFFYLLFPFIFLKILKRPTRWLVATTLCWVVTVYALDVLWSLKGHGFALTSHEAHVNPATDLLSQFIMYFPPLRISEFLFGIILFAYWSRDRRLKRPLIFFVTFVLLITIVVLMEGEISDVVLHNGLTVIVWAPLILAGASMNRGPLNWPLFVFLGRLSFSFYLTHIPAAQIVLALNKYLIGSDISSSPWSWALGTTILALALSVAMYVLIEAPGRRYIMSRWSGRRSLAQGNVVLR
ncbi:acyltransferase family protein [Hansschlegelia zhihuaiae]|uniref:Acyltransferase n=1 Tax=Hansschlegelia zhihuaiae TaxID=405005 RepID=A0A4Q0MC91_9HYPH|nr:acyltransferase [Hansschlegelia zhihuaiae]RXF70957.1 acyltransferase [Hansschlegelia zhihuaiae]